jgi:hypothetical protein
VVLLVVRVERANEGAAARKAAMRTRIVIELFFMDPYFVEN